MWILADYINAHERITSENSLNAIIKKKRLQVMQLDRFLDCSLREIKRIKKIRRRNILEDRVSKIREAFIKQ